MKCLHDSSACFSKIVRWSGTKQHREFAEHQVLVRQQFLRELQSELQPEVEPVSTTLKGLWQRGRGLLGTLLPNADRRMLDATDQSETATLYAYLQALEGNPSSVALREKLQRQQTLVTHSQRKLRELRRRG